MGDIVKKVKLSGLVRRGKLLKPVHAVRDWPEVEAIVQLGANFPLRRLADEAERWLGKPVIAINKATYWHALRRNGILDRRYGHGRLMWEF